MISLASCYVLSKLTVLHHSSLNCLRRMIAILATSIYFHKGLSVESIIGLFTSFTAFISFTYFRNQRVQNIKVKDSNVQIQSQDSGVNCNEEYIFLLHPYSSRNFDALWRVVLDRNCHRRSYSELRVFILDRNKILRSTKDAFRSFQIP